MTLPPYAPTMLRALLPEVLLLLLAGVVLVVDLIGRPQRRRSLGKTRRWIAAAARSHAVRLADGSRRAGSHLCRLEQRRRVAFCE